MAEGGFGCFDPDFEVASVGIRWRKYKARFENYMVAKTSKKFTEISPEVKLASLLHHVGEKVFDMYQAVANEKHSFDDVVKELDKFFVEKVNIKFVFSQTRQARNEPFDVFVNKLRVLVKNCGYRDPNAELKSRIIQGCFSETLRIQALNDANMTLDELISNGRNMELAKSQSSMIVEEKMKMVGAVGSKHAEVKYNDKKCDYCGKSHKPGASNCPAKGKKCNKCSRFNHFSAVCKSSSSNGRKFERSFDRSKTGRRVGCVTVEKEDENDGYVYSVSFGNLDLPTTEVEMAEEKLKLKMLIDTGCSLNIIDEPTFEKFRVKPKLESVSGQVFGFQNKSPLTFRGEFKTQISYGSNRINAKVAVIRGAERCLLEYGSASELGLVKIIHNVEEKTVVHGDSREYWEKRYQEIFSDK